MNGQQLYELYERKNIEVMNCEVDSWDSLEEDDQQIWVEMADAIATEFDPAAARAGLAERLASAECIIRQAAQDTFGREMTPKEFADASSYDS